MLKNTCYLCLSVNKRTTNIYKTHLQHVYESLAQYKISDHECWMCYICHTRLQQCHRLQQLAVQTRGLIDDLGQSKNKIEFGVFESLLELSIYKIENTTIIHPTACNIKQELDVKIETSYEDVTQEDESVETSHDCKENEPFSVKLEENELLSDAGWDQDILSVDSCRRSRVRSMKNTTTTHPTACSIKQELDVKTETYNENVTQEDESVKTSHDCKENEPFSVKLQENELLSDAGWKQDTSSVDSCRRSRMPESILVRRRQSVDERSVESEDMKHEIEEEVGDTGVEQDVEKETAIVSEGRDHASEAQSGCHKTPHRCDVCSKTFTAKCHLLDHITVHTGEKPFSCDICKNKFRLKRNLKLHLLVHNDEKPFSCDICKKGFAQKGNWKDHLRVHTGEKPFSCNVCKKNFTIKGNLQKHLLVHTDKKTFSCDICKKNFTKGYLHKHLLVHTGEKSFKCDICKKKFKHRGSLNAHSRIHTGEKPFSCDICLKSFTQNKNLKVHMQMHTRQK